MLYHADTEKQTLLSIVRHVGTLSTPEAIAHYTRSHIALTLTHQSAQRLRDVVDNQETMLCLKNLYRYEEFRMAEWFTPTTLKKMQATILNVSALKISKPGMLICLIFSCR